MAKISPVSSKYIVHSTINIDGVVDRPDVIGAIFGQTEGLLGSDLELRELQRSGRIGRIEVNIDAKQGKTVGTIVIPSSLDKAETAIIASALEIIQRIGPCNAKIQVQNIEDVRISKRQFVIERAKELLRTMVDSIMPDSQELADEVAYSVRVMEITEYGPDKLPAGPSIDESDEVIVVEGRADVINMLKHGFKNVIGMNGSNVPQTIIDLGGKKILTIFVDGDRGGDLNIKELAQVTEIDFVTKAPDGKEVEELTKKEIHKALRSKVSAEQAKLEINTPAEVLNKQRHGLQNALHGNNHGGNNNNNRFPPRQNNFQPRPPQAQSMSNTPTSQVSSGNSGQSSSYNNQPRPPMQKFTPKSSKDDLPSLEKTKFKEMLEALIGTRGAYILDEKLEILGKVPTTELASTVKAMSKGIYAVVFDGDITKELVPVAEQSDVKYLVAMTSKVTSSETKLNLVTLNSL